MENETECTGFLARTTIIAETKARLDKTESFFSSSSSRIIKFSKCLLSFVYLAFLAN
ncbi:hypothetical protein DCAR_0623396 [Daucus carota subsp. sativus]|uniref:Uncharacterized protein n=1 Tax=Daucus carota subsp. sativus TaxID=79200 RepID=A0AAF0XCX3_DAUCS|nr:hypothetical protein DCAR_0623396 [Daucus carota subsp. sativus]